VNVSSRSLKTAYAAAQAIIVVIVKNNKWSK